MRPAARALLKGVTDMMIATYLVYLVLSLSITYWVGQSLHRNGRVFLVENFQGQEALADSINHLLLVAPKPDFPKCALLPAAPLRRCRLR
jgi:hypothetical protein